MAGVRAPGRTRRSRRAPGAASHRTSGWNQIDWKRAEREVKRLQQRIAKATMEGRWGKVRTLQHLLTRSFFGKALAVRRATTNRGSKTPGVDQVIWKTTAHKYQAIHLLRARGYRPQPLRRVYIDKRDKKAKRPLGIPTMADRAMQALYLLALEPIAETTGDRSSYGFRPRRSTHDAIAQCFTLLSRQNSPTWILEADIHSCFDLISHDMLEERIPMETTILHKWLKAGYIEEAAIHRTEAGTPQGGIISPVMANMALDGLQGFLEQQLPRIPGSTRQRVHLVRYADDCVPRTLKEVRWSRENRWRRCCTSDGGRPFGVALQGEAPNHRQLRRHNGRGGERDGKGAPPVRQVRARKANADKPLNTCRKRREDVETGRSR